MEGLKGYKEQLETSLRELNKFEGLESDLIQKHGNLRAQFSKYREAIETSNTSEQEKREHYGIHDELIKKLHKLVLETKALTRKRTEQMTRDELFKLSQERQKALKPQSAEDKVGEEVTKSLKRMLETMRSEVERSSANISTARSTTKNLEGTTENYQNLTGTLDESRGLIRDLWRRNRSDMIYIFGALGVFVSTVVWIILQRTPGFVWLPAKAVVNQISNLAPKANKFVDKITEVAESILSDEETSGPAPEMFVDTIAIDGGEEFGSDELLKDEGPANEIKGDSVKFIEDESAENIKVESVNEVKTAPPVTEIVESPVHERIEESIKESREEPAQEFAQESEEKPVHESVTLADQQNVHEPAPIELEKRDESQLESSNALINEPMKEIKVDHEAPSEIPEITNLVQNSADPHMIENKNVIQENSSEFPILIEKESDAIVSSQKVLRDIKTEEVSVAETIKETPYNATPSDSEREYYSSDAEVYSSTEEHVEL